MQRLGLDVGVGSPRAQRAATDGATAAAAAAAGAAKAALADGATLALLRAALARHPLLAALDAAHQHEVIEHLERVELGDGEPLPQARASATKDLWGRAVDMHAPCYVVVERGSVRVAASAGAMAAAEAERRDTEAETGARSPVGPVPATRCVRAGESCNEGVLLGGHGIPLAAAGIAVWRSDHLSVRWRPRAPPQCSTHFT